MLKKKTVSERIFLNNTWMVLVVLFVFFVINAAIAKIYVESIEREFWTSMKDLVDENTLKAILTDYTIHQNKFLLLAVADAILCLAVLVFVSQFFTKKMADYVMMPLKELTEGAKRIRSNDLSTDVVYEGDAEFEEVCNAFNEMRRAIVREQEKTRKYEQARTDMIAGISHDLKTPLTAVRGTIKGLIDGVAATKEQQARFLEIAYRRTGDMDRLLNQLFYLSKLESGSLPVTCRPLAISEFLCHYIRKKQELFINEPIELSAETGAVRGFAQADMEQLERIFDNLVENSRKYAEADLLRIHITLKELEEGYEITFLDNGVGVPEEKLPYLFEEFYRADESRNKKEGNGLGLYIVKHLVEAMGGSVRAGNANGFFVCFTLKKAKDQGEQENG